MSAVWQWILIVGLFEMGFFLHAMEYMHVRHVSRTVARNNIEGMNDAYESPEVLWPLACGVILPFWSHGGRGEFYDYHYICKLL